MHTPLGVITGLFTLTAALIPATVGIFVYLLIDRTGPLTIIEVASIISLFVSLVLFIAIPWNLTRPLPDETKANLSTVRRYLATGLAFLMTAIVIHTSEAVYIKRISNPAIKTESQTVQPVAITDNEAAPQK